MQKIFFILFLMISVCGHAEQLDGRVTVDWHKKDQYGRAVGKVLINGVDANQEQIKSGMAWFYKKYQNELVLDDRLGYLHAEEAAKANKTGLWSDLEVIAPWNYRKQRKANFK